MSTDKIAVLGAGANGASIGADLTAAGLDVTLIEQWPEHVETMRSDGVTIKMPDGVQQVPVHVLHLCDVATLTARFGIVLMLMKAYDSRWAAHLIAPYLEPDGVLVGVQNGMTVDAIADVVGHERTLGCVIEISSMMFEPGIIERHSPPDRSWFALGPLEEGTGARLNDVADLLRHSGTVEISDDIRAAKWMKLVSNASTLVPTAILGLPMLAAADIPDMRALMIAAGQEALEAMVIRENPIIPIFGMGEESVAEEQLIDRMLDWLLDNYVLPDTKTTVLQDWTKGRRSEVDDINGLVAATHRDRGGSAPVNEAIVALAHRIERRELAPDLSNLDTLLTDAERRGWRP